jgi:hypothetical protein
MACTFEPDDKGFEKSDDAKCPGWVREAMGPGPVEGGPPRVFLGETEGVEIWGIADFFEREQLMDDLEREATERLRSAELEEAA